MSKMRKPYTAFPLDKPDPGLEGETKMWIPMLWIRCSFELKAVPPILAVVDSGSPYCLFRTDVADFLQIDLTNAPTCPIGGVIGGPKDTLYFHRIRVQVENNWTFEVMGGFMKKLSVPAILGRSGFFDKFLITFDHTSRPREFEIEKIERVN
jgi:hypothetical protein